MKLLFDFFPILLFFIAYKLFGIYVATAVAIAASLLQVASFWIKFKRFETMHIITFLIISLLGGATLLLHNDMFIKWKPTAIYWVFAIAFLLTHLIGDKPLIQRMMDTKLNLPKPVWNKLNLCWILFFTAMGIANLYVVYHYSTNAWVNFKVFGTLGLTIAFIVMQSLYMAKYIEKQD